MPEYGVSSLARLPVSAPVNHYVGRLGYLPVQSKERNPLHEGYLDCFHVSLLATHGLFEATAEKSNCRILVTETTDVNPLNRENGSGSREFLRLVEKLLAAVVEQ